MPFDRTVSVGEWTFRVRAVRRGGQWVAYARRADSGERFGLTQWGPTPDEAIERLCRWLSWQADHKAALGALQEAESAYQRIVTESAFAVQAEEPSPAEVQAEALQRVDEARQHLDEVRRQRPEDL